MQQSDREGRVWLQQTLCASTPSLGTLPAILGTSLDSQTENEILRGAEQNYPSFPGKASGTWKSLAKTCQPDPNRLNNLDDCRLMSHNKGLFSTTTLGMDCGKIKLIWSFRNPPIHIIWIDCWDSRAMMTPMDNNDQQSRGENRGQNSSV